MIIKSSAGRGAQGRGNETNGPAFLPDLAASWLERSCAGKANSLLRLVIEDLYPGRIALVSSFGADAAALLHMVSQIDKATPSFSSTPANISLRRSPTATRSVPSSG